MQINVDIYAPWVNEEDCSNMQNISFIQCSQNKQYDVISVNNHEFKQM